MFCDSSIDNKTVIKVKSGLKGLQCHYLRVTEGGALSTSEIGGNGDSGDENHMIIKSGRQREQV